MLSAMRPAKRVAARQLQGKSSVSALGSTHLNAASAVGSTRGYRHWYPAGYVDFKLWDDCMPSNMKDVMASKEPSKLDFVSEYWYHRLRSEATILDPENLPKKNYKELCRDLGLGIITKPVEHVLGILELYEYLKSSPFVGPFGTVKNPVLIPSITTERVVGCTGGAGDDEHYPLWFRCREGFLYRCGECDQIFMHVRVLYEATPDEELPWKNTPMDPEVGDVFDWNLVKKGHDAWKDDGGDSLWPVGARALGERIRSEAIANK